MDDVPLHKKIAPADAEAIRGLDVFSFCAALPAFSALHLAGGQQILERLIYRNDVPPLIKSRKAP